MGLPCITTPLASDALEARDKQELLVAKTALEFEQKIINILAEASEFKHLGSQGREFVESNYSWDQAINRLSKLLNTRPESA
jgi:glycosyltransferase involved in cell wall biosynthesis